MKELPLMGDVVRRYVNRTNLLLLLLFPVNGAWNCQATDVPLAQPDASAAEIFRSYLSRPPCVQRILYTDYSTFVPQSKYAFAVNGSDYVCRQIENNEDLSLRVGATNRLHPRLLFLGRSGDLRWNLRGFDLRKAVAEATDGTSSDPYIILVDGFRSSIDRVINFGPSRVLPGTFVWSGSDFHATADPIMTNGTGHPEFATVRGKAKEENGKIVELSCVPFGGTYRYEYDKGSTLPVGFPSRVSIKDPRSGGWVKLFEYHKVVLSTPETIDKKIFEPESYVDPEFVVITASSNNVVTTQPTDERVVKLSLDQLDRLRKESPSGSKWFSGVNLLRSMLLLAFVVPIIFIIRSSACKKTPHQPKL